MAFTPAQQATTTSRLHRAGRRALGVAPHDCTGPVTLMASVHLCMHVPNALTQEVVRAFNHGWYPRLVTALPRIEAGYVYAPEAPGLGLALRPEVFARTDLLIQASVPQE